jgi:hypothetical protein
MGVHLSEKVLGNLSTWTSRPHGNFLPFAAIRADRNLLGIRTFDFYLIYVAGDPWLRR